VQEQHEVPPKMRTLCHCRFYQAGHWFGSSEFMVKGNLRMSKILNQIFEPKQGKVFFEQNSGNVVPTVIQAADNDDPTNSELISINEYMMQFINTNIESIQGKVLCRTCELFEMREVESDLTIVLEVDYNDILELILEQDPTLNS